MPTINDPQEVDNIIAANGISPGRSPVVRIVEYINQWGFTAYGLVYEGQDLEKYHTSPACRHPVTLWERE